MTYAEAIQFLHSLAQFGSHFGLENPRRLAAIAGNPQDRLRFIHVAGTNGKGSTCAMLEGIYRAAGLRVGLYTSPHLVRFSERIQINRQPIADVDVARLVATVAAGILPAVEPGILPGGKGASNVGAADFISSTSLSHPDPGGKMPLSTSGRMPETTFFEFVTVMALLYFAEQQCDLVIWETGLGGRLDATNIVTPLASIITNIQFDHEHWLGHTLAKIAAEKAGIIKPGVPAITGANEPEALAVIQRIARCEQSPLTLVTPDQTRRPPLDEIELPLLGWHQRLNAALALATVKTLQATLPVSDAAIRDGLAHVQWPGRMQLVKLPGGQRILLDGAHNPGGAATLSAALAEHFPGVQPALILGVLEDKSWQLMCEILAPLARRVWCVPVSSGRTTTPEMLAGLCQHASPAAEVRACPSLADALRAVTNEPFVVIAGSLYLVGEAMEQLHLATPPGGNEKGLNEWGAAAAPRA